MSETTSAAAHTSTTSARTRIDIRTAALWAGAVVLLVLPTYLAFKTGGYLPTTQQLSVAIVSVVLAVVAIASPWPLISGRWQLLAVGALASFAYRLSSDRPASLEGTAAIVEPLVISIVIVAQWYYAKRMTNADVLR